MPGDEEEEGPEQPGWIRRLRNRIRNRFSNAWGNANVALANRAAGVRMETLTEEEIVDRRRRFGPLAGVLLGAGITAGATVLGWYLHSRGYADVDHLQHLHHHHGVGNAVHNTVGGEAGIGDHVKLAADEGYPWDWAEHQVGPDHAETWLHELGQRAAAHGHEVVWHPSELANGQATEWVSVDGNSDTQHVVDILNRFRDQG